MQREFFGVEILKNLKNLLDEYNANKFFLVCGKRSFDLSGSKEKIKPFVEGIPYTIFNPTSNPEIEGIKKGISVFKKFKPDIVVAVGGGSVIDAAKAINILSFQSNDPMAYIAEGEKLENKGMPLIAIPTTAGTGSESTKFATIYVNKKKRSLESEKIIPDVTLVDPTLTYSLPPYLTAYTGLDALCQAIESFWSINSTEKSRKYAGEAIKLAYENIVGAVKNNTEARTAMAKAAHLSGKAINISKTTACHSVSYPLTANFNIPHGHAVALTMPSFLEFNSMIKDENCNDKRGSKFVKKNLQKLFSIMDCYDASEAKNKFSELMTNIGVITRLSKLGIGNKGIDLILDEGFTPDRMGNNPRKVTKNDLRNILTEIR